jgi:high-affinity iron transporter
MAVGFLLGLREGLEAALIVSLLLGSLRRTRHAEMMRIAWLGVALASALSLGIGALLVSIGASLEGTAEAIFEGGMLTLAVGVLTWIVLWVQGHRGTEGTQAEMRRAATAGQRWAVFLTAFVAVGREGLETGLFVSAGALVSETRAAVAGAGLGLAAAALLGVALYSATLRLNLRPFFTITSIMLVLFAAGLLSHGVHEFSELGWIPSGPEPVWDTGRLLPVESLPGQTAAILLGYDPAPSLAQVIAQLGYLVTMAAVLLLRVAPRSTDAGATTAD